MDEFIKIQSDGTGYCMQTSQGGLVLNCPGVSMVENVDLDENGALRFTLRVNMSRYNAEMVMRALNLHAAPAPYPHEREMTAAARALAEAASLMADAMKQGRK